MSAFDEDHEKDMADPEFAAGYWKSRFDLTQAEVERLRDALIFIRQTGYEAGHPEVTAAIDEALGY